MPSDWLERRASRSIGTIVTGLNPQAVLPEGRCYAPPPRGRVCMCPQIMPASDGDPIDLFVLLHYIHIVKRGPAWQLKIREDKPESAVVIFEGRILRHI